MHASQKTICVLLIIIFAFEGMLLTFLPCLQVLANTRAKRGVGDDAPMNDFMNSRGHHKGGSGVKMKKPARSFSKKSWKVSKSKKPHENESTNNSGDSISDNVEPTQRRLQNQRQSQQAEHRQLKTSSSSSSGTQLPHGVKPRISSSSTSGHGTMAVVAAEGLLPQSPALNASTSGSSSSGSGTPSSNSHDSTGGSHRSGGGGVITIYLATDALDLREQVECSPQCLFYLCAAFLALLLLSTIILK
jgi:hypothetical protein